MKTKYTQFNNPNDVTAWANQFKSCFPSDSDSDKEFISAINYYTSNANVPINRFLRCKNKNPIEASLIYNTYKQMVSKLPTYQIPDNVVVFRYISHQLLKEMCPSFPPKKDMIISDKGFMSTTMLRNSLFDFRKTRNKLDVLLVISIPKGTRGTYVGLLQDSLSEYEIILAPNTHLRIDSKLPFSNRCLWCTVIN